MQQIRQSIWETNSSSTHSLCLHTSRSTNIPHFSFLKIDSDFICDKNIYPDGLCIGQLDKLVFLIAIVNGLSENVSTYLNCIKDVVFEEFSTTLEIDYTLNIEDDNESNEDILIGFISITSHNEHHSLNETNFKDMVREVLRNPDIILEGRDEEY